MSTIAFLINVVGIVLGYHWFGPWFTVPFVLMSVRYTKRFKGLRVGE